MFGVGMSNAGSLQTATRSEAITSQDRDAFETALASRAYKPPDGVSPVFSSEFAPEMPAFRDVLIGEDGRIWVQDPERPGRDPLVWRANEGDGPVTRVQLPARFFPLRFGQAWVLGVSYDDMTVERVQLYELVEGAVDPPMMSHREAQPPRQSHCHTWSSR